MSPGGWAPRVCALVVTYNRKELLLECLGALERQTVALERIVLVDNASSDGTPERLAERGWLERRELTYERLAVNAGSAGGFARGIELAREGEEEWIFVMDDDAEPRPDGLARLLAAPAAADPRTAALCGTVLDTAGVIEARNHRGHFRGRQRPLPVAAYRPGTEPEVDYASFVGLLVRADVARRTAPPKAELFIWGDDVEYCFRLRDHGPIRLVPESEVLHKDVGQAYSNRRGRFWNRLLGWDLVSTPLEGFWRNLCGLRNYIWIKKTYEHQSAPSAVGTTAQLMLKALLYDEQPLRRLPWLARFALDGRLGVFHTIPPAEWVARVRRGEV